ncbi:107-domain-containing protein [Tricharina praecox]|uniref:107-domain-containing protein n=1 Tax=Tricharina praecox TaxID=43433 RepID=UPI00221E9279|nr:107-domain-containing protein [Tricharina praecox]KAI5855637.1 107-domain-containing protein [Tricharina praecox]
MAPIFGDSSRPKRKSTTTNTAANGEKPVFAFNAPSTSGSSGFFRTDASPLAQHRPQQMEDGWDMGEDRSDESQVEMDDSRAEYETSDTEIELIKPEFVAFATRLDDSGILRQPLTNNTEESAAAAYDLISTFQSYAAVLMEESERALEDMTDTTLEDPREEYDINETKEQARYWQLEHQTWELFGALISHRLSVGNRRHDMNLPGDLANDRFSSDVRIREHFFDADTSFTELTIVLEWLRRYSPAPTADEIEVPGLYREGGGWIYTKEEIKKQKRMNQNKQLSLFGARGSAFTPASSQNYVTELDPDAPSRQGRQLEEQDEAWEQYLMKLVWGFLRKGEIDTARDMCEDAGEFWRAASLNGGLDAWDPRIDGVRETDEEDFAVKGNRRRELWKRMCYALARRRGGNPYEKASYGILCGDVESVLPVCTTWEDLLFAHVNSLVEGFYSAKLAELSRIPAAVTRFPSFDAIAYHTRGSLSDETIMPRILDEIAANSNVKEAKLPLRSIQGSLISLRFPALIQELARQLRQFEEVPDYDPQKDDIPIAVDATDPRTLRVAVHILMVLQALNAGSEEGTAYHVAAERVISGYVSTLGECDKFELVPLYASRLSPEKAIAIVGKTLVHFKGDGAKREELIQQMHHHGIDVDGCLKKTMEISLQLSEPHYSTSIVDGAKSFNGFTGELRPEDQQLISGLEWLMLGSVSLQSELVRGACDVYKRFLLTGRLYAAKTLHTDVHSNRVIFTRGANGHSGDPMEENEGNGLDDSEETQLLVAVYLAMESLIDAMIALEEWREALKNLPERPDRTTARRLKPVYDKVVRYLAPMVKDFCDEEQLLQLTGIRQIRQIYVPEMVIALHNVYMDAGNYINPSYMMNALELTAEVANPGKNILDTFRETGRLAEYVDVIAAASRTLLGATQDGAKDLVIWAVDK